MSSLRPALRRSPPALDAEAKAGLFPWRGIVVASLVEIVAVLATAVAHPVENTALAAIEEQPRSHDVIFFSADELPRTRDLGGAPLGEEGKSGGASAHHAVQTIRVARGQKVQERVLDAPQLNLPKSDSAIKNLLSFKADAGPAPAEALPSIRRALTLPMAVAPPPPEMRDQLRRPQLQQQQVAPPPVELSADLASRRNLAVQTAVVPPPVSAPPQTLSRRAQLTLPAEAVVGPRPEINASTRRRETLAAVTNVVPPPVELSAAHGRSLSGFNGNQNVAPPPVDLNAARGRSLAGLSGGQVVAPPPVDLQNVTKARGAASLGNNAVVAPPVEMTSRFQSRAPLTGSGAVAPPEESKPAKSNQSSSAGVIVSPKPGEKSGQPSKPEPATLAMSPVGNSSGSGGTGNGSGITHGNATGSSSAGSNSGAGFSGAGKSADASPRTGSSTYAGPGGAGDKYSGRVPGVSVSGGTNTITLPSFGGPEPKAGGHSDVHKNSNGITVVASPRAGGAMNYYGLLKGDRVYTIYFKTAAGMVSLQFADPDSTAHAYSEDLIAPQALRTEVPNNSPARLVLKCVLDRTGVLKNISVLQSTGAEFENQVLAAVPGWKFSPAYRGSEPVEVSAILGFGVDTK